MGMTLHPLSAGKGYEYLTKTVAHGDVERKPGQSLSNYYAGEHGTPPGQWWGKGAAVLGVDGAVTEEQMKALYGHGMHPQMEENVKALVAQGMDFEEAKAQQQLGTKYTLYDAKRGNVVSHIVETLELEEKQLGRLLTKDEESELGMKVAKQDFFAAFGREPEDTKEVERWIWTEEKKTRTSIAGFDLTFSAPKSISVLWGLGDDQTRSIIEQAHNKAVTQSLELLEKEAAFSRVGRNALQIDTEGLTVARFMHYDTRAGDMDLHTHCTVSNKVLCTDGKWRALDGRGFFHLSAVAGSEYNSVLINELRNELGVSFVAVDHGLNKQPVMEIAGVDAELITQFSKRSEAIEQLAQKLVNEYREKYCKEPSETVRLQLRQQANLETRQAKDEPHSLRELHDRWAKEAGATLNITGDKEHIAEYLSQGVKQYSALRAREFEPENVISAALKQVAVKRAHWRIGHLQTALNHELMHCHFASDKDRLAVREQCQQAALAQCSVALPNAGRAHSVDSSRLLKTNGESIFHAHMSQEYATPEIIVQENNVLDGLETPIADVLTREQTDTAIAAIEAEMSYPLLPGQRDLVHHFTGVGTLVAGGVGPAGTGKTTAMKVVSEAWQTSGRTVLALGTSAAAAQILGNEIGVKHSTIADILVRHANGLDIPVQRGSLLLVDEAGMSSTRELSAIVDIARERGACVRLLGDPRQVDAVESGGILRTIVEKWDCPELQTVVRFKDPKEAEASLLLREGRSEATAFYVENNRLHMGDILGMQNEAVTRWTEDVIAGKESILLADTNSVVSELNAQAQYFKVASGAVDPTQGAVTTRRGEAIHVGDVIMTTLNQNIRGDGGGDVRNRNLWHVLGIDGGALRVRDYGNLSREVTLPRAYVNRNVVLGYALTVDKAQGMTTDTAYSVLNPESVTSNRMYVAVTRGKENNEVFFAEPTMLSIAIDDEHDKRTHLAEPAEVMNEILSRRQPSPSVAGHIGEAVEDYLSRDHAAARFAKEQELLITDYAEHLITTELPVGVRAVLASSPEKSRELVSSIANRYYAGADVRKEFQILTGTTGIGEKALLADKPLEYFLSAQNKLFGSAASLREGRSWVLPPQHAGQDSALLEAARKDLLLAQYSDFKQAPVTQRSLEAAQQRFGAQQRELLRQWADGVISHNDLAQYGVSPAACMAIADDTKARGALIWTLSSLAERGITLDAAMSCVKCYQGSQLKGVEHFKSPAAGMSALLRQSVEYPRLLEQLNETPAPCGVKTAYSRMEAADRRAVMRAVAAHVARGATVESVYEALGEKFPQLNERLEMGSLAPSALAGAIKECTPQREEGQRPRSQFLPDSKHVDAQLLIEAQHNAGVVNQLETRLRAGVDNPYAQLSDSELKLELVKLETQYDTLGRQSSFWRESLTDWKTTPVGVALPADAPEIMHQADRIDRYHDAVETRALLQGDYDSYAHDAQHGATEFDRLAAQDLMYDASEKLAWAEGNLEHMAQGLPPREQWVHIQSERTKFAALQANVRVTNTTGQEMLSQLVGRTDAERAKVAEALVAVRAQAAAQGINVDRVWVDEARHWKDMKAWQEQEKKAQEHVKKVKDYAQQHPNKAEQVMHKLGAGVSGLTQAEQTRLRTTSECYHRVGDETSPRFNRSRPQTAPRVEQYVPARPSVQQQEKPSRGFGMEL